MTTIRDVAQRSGISIKTVSRVINGADTVRPNIRAKVEQAIRELNYRPALAARQLATGRSLVIVMLVPDVAHWYYSRLLLAAAQACKAIGYHLVVEPFRSEKLECDANWSLALTCNADAVIVPPPWSDDARMLAALEGLGLPTVRIAGRRQGYGDIVEVHDRQVSREVVEHLIAQGHSRIAMIAPPGTAMASEERHLGYRDAMAAAGLEVPDPFVVRGTMLFQSGAEALQQLMALPVRPTAVFAVNDECALGAMTAALRLGFRVPQDLAFAGFDNSAQSRSAYPALTTVEQPIEAIAQAAVALATGREAGQEDFTPRLILRESSLKPG
ncbi:MAG TPA: LacI family DNA-binding transcriptional regulator [Novosphingobium sp.]|nr:LacI family DNA-binding transcriptional regulator [Novosphingobium sp.]